MDRFEIDSETGRIVPLGCAATMYRGKVYVGTIHPLIKDEIKEQHSDFSESHCLEGFLLKDRKFVTRDEAKLIAREHDVVRPGRQKWIDPELYTEDLPESVTKEFASFADYKATTD